MSNYTNRSSADEQMQDIDDINLMATNSAGHVLVSQDQNTQQGNVSTPSNGANNVTEPPMDKDSTLPTNNTVFKGEVGSAPAPRGRRRKKESTGSGSEDEYAPNSYQRKRLRGADHWVRRSVRQTRQVTPLASSATPSEASSDTHSETLSGAPAEDPLGPPPEASSAVLSETSPRASYEPSAGASSNVSSDASSKASAAAPAQPRAPNLDRGEGSMPSAENGFRFKYDSPSGRTAAELDELFKLPAHPKQFPTDLQGQKQSDVKKSYRQLGAKPRKGLADDLVAAMEAEHEKRLAEEEKRMAEEDKRRNEGMEEE